MCQPQESICRENIAAYFKEIEGYTNPGHDGFLAAWMMAKVRAQDLVDDLQTVCDAISHRPMMNPGQQALRAVAADSTPDYHPVFADAIKDVIAARGAK
jgi:hypothetical protein